MFDYYKDFSLQKNTAEFNTPRGFLRVETDNSSIYCKVFHKLRKTDDYIYVGRIAQLDLSDCLLLYEKYESKFVLKNDYRRYN